MHRRTHTHVRLYSFALAAIQACLDHAKGLLQTVKSKQGRYCGLLVRSQHAEKFILPEGDRKIYEIRSKPLQFLKEGEKIVLISTKNGKRFALCVLEFQGCVKIKMSLFMKYYNLHRVSAGEFADFTASWPSMDLVGHGILIWSVNSECASQSR